MLQRRAVMGLMILSFVIIAFVQKINHKSPALTVSSAQTRSAEVPNNDITCNIQSVAAQIKKHCCPAACLEVHHGGSGNDEMNECGDRFLSASGCTILNMTNRGPDVSCDCKTKR